MPTPTVEEIKPIYQNERFLEEKNQDYSSNSGLYKVQIGEAAPKQDIIKKNSELGVHSERVIPNIIKERIEESKRILLLDGNWDGC